jgi:integrase
MRRTPITENGKVLQLLPPRRQPNRATRTREHLIPAEVEKLVTSAGKVGRYGHRDSTLLLLAYRHGLRVSEVVELQWSQVDLQTATLHVNRVKNGKPAAHPLTGDELRALRSHAPREAYIFLTERGGPLTTSTVRKPNTYTVSRGLFLLAPAQKAHSEQPQSEETQRRGFGSDQRTNRVIAAKADDVAATIPR